MPDASAVTHQLEQAFERVWRERMEDVPILNPALRVQAVGTRLFNGNWLSILITPWFINVMLLPGSKAEAEKWATYKSGASIGHILPAGRFDFIVGDEPGLGRFQMCSLFSPVLEFADQEAAVVAAEAALAELFDAGQDDEPGEEQRIMGGLSRGRLPQELAEQLEQDNANHSADSMAPAPQRNPGPAPSRRAVLTGTPDRGGTESQ